MATKDESFFSRWNRRKTEAKSGVLAEEELQIADEVIDQQLTSSSEASDVASESGSSLHSEPEEAPILSDEDMPDVETLNEDSNFSQFFSEGVSDELRNKALRKLFHLPEFNIRDGLNDYDEDFTQIPKLSQALAGQVRQWVEEQKEEFKAELNSDDTSQADNSQANKDSIKGTSDPEQSKKPDENTQPPTRYDFSDVTEDDLGDADLEG